MAAAVKLVPLVFVPYLFVTRQTRAAWTALATFAACSLVATAVRPGHVVVLLDEVRHRRLPGGQPVLHPQPEPRRGRSTVWPTATCPALVVDALGALVLVAGIALARWAWRDSSPFLGILVCATTGMVVSPITWEHHLVWAVPILLWLALAPDRPAGGPVWAAAAAGVLWWAPLQHVPSGGDHELHEHGWTLLAGQLVLRPHGGVPGRRGRPAGRPPPAGGAGPVRGPRSPAASTAAAT